VATRRSRGGKARVAKTLGAPRKTARTGPHSHRHALRRSSGHRRPECAAGHRASPAFIDGREPADTCGSGIYLALKMAAKKHKRLKERIRYIRGHGFWADRLTLIRPSITKSV